MAVLYSVAEIHPIVIEFVMSSAYVADAVAEYFSG